MTLPHVPSYSPAMGFASILVAVTVAATPMTTGGGVAGIVTDADTGGPLRGAVVTLDDLGIATVTDEDGWYWLLGVPPGPQHLTVGHLGYRARTIHVLVPAGETLRVDLVLDTEPIEVEAVVVRGRIPLPGLAPDGSEPDLRRRISAAAVRNDPFAAEPDPLDALVGGSVARSPESAAGLHVRGGASDQVGYVLDGFPVFSPYHAGARSSAWSAAAVSELELRDSPALPTDALSGTVVATTVEPRDRFRSAGTASTSHVHLGLDGPLRANTGVLLDARYGFPDLVSPSRERSHLRGEDHDLIAKLVSDVGGGRMRLLAFDNRNVLRFASVSTDLEGPPPEERGINEVAWRSGTFGVGWDSDSAPAPRWSARAWRSGLDATVRWWGSDPSLRHVESERVQIGASGSVTWSRPRVSTEIGALAQRDRLAYRVAPGDDRAVAFAIRDRVASAGVYARHARRPVDAVELRGEVKALHDRTGLHVLPLVGMRWMPMDRLTLHARYAGTRQLTQSLRNEESIIGAVFPPELPVRATEGARVARARSGVMGMVATPWNGAGVSVEAYLRSVDGLALVAPRDGRPFATVDPVYGSGTIRGATLEFVASAARYGAVASWGIEDVELRAPGVEYSPGHATRQRIRVGGIVFPSPSLSVRVAWIGEFGRRGTDVIGVVEWESCNLLDGGCEIAGTPEALGPLGATRLPSYRRLDLSVRKHWHVPIGRREARVELFAAGSNLFGRDNVLTYAVDPATGARDPIEMRPAAPVAFGVGWTF